MILFAPARKWLLAKARRHFSFHDHASRRGIGHPKSVRRTVEGKARSTAVRALRSKVATPAASCPGYAGYHGAKRSGITTPYALFHFCAGFFPLGPAHGIFPHGLEGASPLPCGFEDCTMYEIPLYNPFVPGPNFLYKLYNLYNCKKNPHKPRGFPASFVQEFFFYGTACTNRFFVQSGIFPHRIPGSSSGCGLPLPGALSVDAGPPSVPRREKKEQLTLPGRQ